MATDEKKEALIKEKAWDKALEPPIYEDWKRNGKYALDPEGKGTLFSIDTPPPYINSPVHMGHAATYSLMDMFARFHRMKGKRILFPLGLDNNGMPIEMSAEKKFNKKLTDIPREEALALCKQIIEAAGMTSVDTFLRLGISFNSWERGNRPGDVYATDSPEYRALTQETFLDMWEKDLIYEDTRINNWDPAAQTPLADAEIVYKDIQTTFNDVAFKVKETGETIVIGTTRPELICTCGMVIFNPEDERYKKLDGKTAVTPIFNKEVPIKAHPMAEIDKGTGLVMMCSAGDLSDIRFFREQGLTPVIAIEKNGTMNEHAGVLKGLHVKKAREKMIELLKENRLLVKQTQTTHRTPISERTNMPIEFIAMPEFYVKQMSFKDDMRRIAKQTRFYEDRSRQLLLDWIDSVSIDWPISRRRFYATEVPLWYCKQCRAPVLGPRGTYVQPWKDPAPVKECAKCKNTEFEGETRVLDTWFDSSISPLYILKWRRDDTFYNAAKPCTLRPQGKEIVRTWLYYTLLKCHQLTGEKTFDDVWIHNHIVDEKGYKMSKSVGNIIDPQKVLEQFGAEPLRLWCAIEGNITSTDLRCSNERIQGAGKTLTKLWNVARFASMFPQPKGEVASMPLDNWIRYEMAHVVEETDEGFTKYDFHNPVVNIKHFIWETFASHYLELVKARAYNRKSEFSTEEQNSALATIHQVLDTLLLVLAPVVPFITHKLYKELHGKDVHMETFPTHEKIEKPSFTSTELEELNSMVWKAKKDRGVSLRAGVKEIVIPESLKPISKELQIMHSAEEVKIGEHASVSLV